MADAGRAVTRSPDLATPQTEGLRARRLRRETLGASPRRGQEPAPARRAPRRVQRKRAASKSVRTDPESVGFATDYPEIRPNNRHYASFSILSVHALTICRS